MRELLPENKIGDCLSRIEAFPIERADTTGLADGKRWEKRRNGNIKKKGAPCKQYQRASGKRQRIRKQKWLRKRNSWNDLDGIDKLGNCGLHVWGSV